MQETIGQNIRQRRLDAGLTLLQLAEAIFGDGRRQSYISVVENGGANITVARLADFASALNCQPSDLLLAVTHKEAV